MLIVLVCISYSLINTIYPAPFINLTAAISAHFILQLIFFLGRWKWRMGLLIGYTGLNILLELAPMLVLDHLGIIQSLSFIYILLLNGLRAGTILILRYFIQGFTEIIDRKVVILYLIYSFGTIFYGIQSVMDFLIEGTQSLNLVIIIICILGIIVLYYTLLLRGHSLELEREKWRLELDLDSNRKYLQVVLEEQEKLRNYRHDLKNFDIGLLSVDEEERLSQIRERLDWIENIGSSHYSYNLVFQNIIHSKLVGVEFPTEGLLTDINVPNTAIMDNVELAVIIGNALDNSVEALSKLNIEKRKLHICAFYYHPGLLISIENTFFPISSKDDGRSSRKRGYGLKSIRRIVESYDGIMRIHEDDERYKLEISLPI
ncbi:MAG: GHKL domain-containing protein [Tissierellia bacterium]|nr:GHKL domain-containing protein [Tissierellia bacterium]